MAGVRVAERWCGGALCGGVDVVVWVVWLRRWVQLAGSVCYSQPGGERRSPKGIGGAVLREVSVSEQLRCRMATAVAIHSLPRIRCVVDK